MSNLIKTLILLSFICSCQDTLKPAETKKIEHVVELDTNRYNVAFLIMDGVYNTELTAPFDIFHHTKFRDSIKAMNVFTIANTLSPITSFEGLRLLPDFDYTANEYPQIDVLVIPSAENHLGSDLKDKAMINFIKQTDKTALYMTSHCDGSFVLAQANLLDNINCTTFPADITTMQKQFPLTLLHDSVLFVHDGKYITSAGGAKSFEAALYLCELLYGKSNTNEIAEGMVIDWDLNSVPHLTIEH